MTLLTLYILGVDRIESGINLILHGAVVPEDGWIYIAGEPYTSHKWPRDGEVKVLGHDSNRCLWITYWVPCDSPDAIIPDESFCDECFKAAFSCDGGATWIRTKDVPVEIWMSGRNLSTERIAYQVLPGQEGLRRKSRNEANWTQVRPKFGIAESSYIHFDLLAVNPADDMELFIAVRGTDALIPLGLYRSLDGGATFQLLRREDAATSYAALGVDPFNPQVIIAQYGHGTIRSENHGETWFKVTDRQPGRLSPIVPLLALPHGGWEMKPYVSSILFDTKRRGHVLAVTNKGLLLSREHGHSWDIINLGTRNFNPQLTIASDADRDAFYVGTKRGLLKSMDGGQTWRRLTLGDERAFWARFLPIVPCPRDTSP